MTTMPALKEWESFYVILGSSAGALIGLQFVVMTLLADVPLKDAERAGSTFATPTIVHFGTVLMLSALACAPWPGISAPAAVWGLGGIAGAAYVAIVAGRMVSQTAYEPVFEDWLFHFLLPIASYSLLVVAAFIVRSHANRALFVVATTLLLLLFIGIHNAWDAVTYHVLVQKQKQKDPQR